MSEIIKFFKYDHLPNELQSISRELYITAVKLDEKLPNGPEKSAGLRKLLEAKDCFVRAAIKTEVKEPKKESMADSIIKMAKDLGMNSVLNISTGESMTFDEFKVYLEEELKKD